jgi:hypothetical protein
MRWGLRAFVVGVVAVATATVGASVGLATSAGTPPGLKIGQPCTYLSAKQVQKVFAAPVTVDPTNRGASSISAGCAYLVGPPGQPTGVLVALLVFPYFSSPGQTAIDALESQRASESLAGLTVEDAKVGSHSYVDIDRSILAVAPNKKFAFSLQWIPTGGSPVGDKLDAKTQKQLTTLAKQIASHPPK